ncbi:amidohydrolase 2 [Pseudohyphozyma bogoriensis]|nr:amidohydrolase 2 [Pseudohyphozyma bogoriensis]
MAPLAATATGDRSDRVFPAGSWDCHHHIFDLDLFPLAATRHFTPANASLAELEAFQHKLGIDHVALAHGLSFGSDISSLEFYLKHFEGTGSAYGVIDLENTTLEELQRLDSVGLRGIRIDFHLHECQNDAEAQVKWLKLYSEKVSPVNWGVQIYSSHPEFWPTLKPVILDLPCPIVFDHFGGLRTASMHRFIHGPDAAFDVATQPGLEALVSTLASGNLYIKLSAPYRCSEDPTYEDMKPIVRALVDANSERVLYGSDWPHTQPFHRRAKGMSKTETEDFVDFDDFNWTKLLKSWLSAEEWELLTVTNPRRLLRYTLDGYEDPVDVVNDVRSRLSRIEELLETFTGRGSLPGPPAFPEPAPLRPPPVDNPPAPTAPPPPPAPAPQTVPRRSEGFSSGEKYFGASASASVDDGGHVVELFTSRPPTTKDSNPGRRLLLDIVQDLPPKPTSDALIDFYFNSINLMRYPLNETAFRSSYDEFWPAIEQESLPPHLVHRLPLTFILLAISCLTAPTQHLPFGNQSRPDELKARQAMALSLYAGSRRAVSLSEVTFQGREDIMLVMAEVLTARYLILIRRATDAFAILGAAIHRAQTMGMHRASKSTRHRSSASEDLRRRVWRYCALLVGQPLSINTDDCDAPLPAFVDEFFAPGDPAEPTTESFLAYRHSLATIMGEIAKEAFAVGGTTYPAIVALEGRLQAWAQCLPSFFSLLPYGTTHPVDTTHHPIVAIHRWVLGTEYHFARITLHRPYLALPDPHGEMVLSRKACVDSSLDDLWARISAPPADMLSTGTYRVTLSIVILGFVSPAEAERMKECLKTFVNTHKGVNSWDENTLRDIAQRELKSLKAGIMAATRASSPIPHLDTQQDQLPASLLAPDFLDSLGSVPFPLPSSFDDTTYSAPSGVTGLEFSNWDIFDGFLEDIAVDGPGSFGY